MSLDGIMLAAIKEELSNILIGARIDKIYQPEKRLITLTVRKNKENINLLISSHPQRARIHITELSFNNPVKPPDFVMLLRKYLIRGIITEIKQPDFERILLIKIIRYNNEYTLVIEIMGKYSNIILVNEDGTILDAITRINHSVSRERELIPGINYKYPPKQDKINPLSVTEEDFFNQVKGFNQSSFKAIMYNFRGIGPDSAKEIINKAGLNPDQSYETLNQNDKIKVWKSFQQTFSRVKEGVFYPSIGLNKDGTISYFSAFPLKHKKEITKEICFNNVSSLLDYYYEKKVRAEILEQKKSNLTGIVKGHLEKNNKKQRKLKQRLTEGKKAEEFKKMGELITANLYQIEGKTKEIEVIDYYHPEQKKKKIIMNPELTPSQNAQRYFKKYNKAKRSITYIQKELGKLRHEQRYLEQVELNIEQAETEEEIKEIKEELLDEGYIKEKKKKKNRNKGKQKPLQPLKYKSSQGYDILVGRNNRQNDYLTKKIANQQDIWLHVKQLPGSHVVVRNHTGGEIPEKTLEEAAILAAHYSKGRISENVPIDYTKIQNVKKPRGAKPGLVYYEDYKTIYVNPDEELIKKLRQNNT